MTDNKKKAQEQADVSTDVPLNADASPAEPAQAPLPLSLSIPPALPDDAIENANARFDGGFDDDEANNKDVELQGSFRLVSDQDFSEQSKKIIASSKHTTGQSQTSPQADDDAMNEVQDKADLRWRVGARAVDTLIFALLAGWTVPYLGPLLGLAYLLLADGLWGGASVGKRIFGLKVKRPRESAPASFFDSILRNAPLGLAAFFALIPIIGWAMFLTLGLAIIAFETYMIWSEPNGVRAGDILAATRVFNAGDPLIKNLDELTHKLHKSTVDDVDSEEDDNQANTI